MRILLTTSLYPTPQAPFALGGAEIFARRFAEQLVLDGHEVEVIRARPQIYIPEETLNGVRIFATQRNNVFIPFSQGKTKLTRGLWHLIDDHMRAGDLIAERIRQFKPDIMHSNTLAGLGASIWQVAHGHGLPILHTLHDYYLTCPRCSRFKHNETCKTTCTSCAFMTLARRDKVKYLSAVVGVSRRVIEIHEQLGLFGQTPVRGVVRNAADPLNAVAREANSAPLVIGYMGRITADKGIHPLVSSIASVPRGLVSLLIAGRIDEQMTAQLRALAPDADIRFLGYVKPEDFFGKVDIVAVPSLWEEPGSLVIEEALAAGRPVIASPYGGSPEAIEAGRTGWIVQPRAADMAALISGIAREPDIVRRMQTALMEQKTHRGMHDVASSYMDLYRQVLALPQRIVA